MGSDDESWNHGGRPWAGPFGPPAARAEGTLAHFPEEGTEAQIDEQPGHGRGRVEAGVPGPRPVW